MKSRKSRNGVVNEEAIRAWMQSRVAKHLRLDPAQIDIDAAFDSFGLDSVQMPGIVDDLQAWVGLRLHATLMFEYSNIRGLAARIARDLSKAKK